MPFSKPPNPDPRHPALEIPVVFNKADVVHQRIDTEFAERALNTAPEYCLAMALK